ncbi:hypothetical protein ACIGO8_30670 [Streptomyces sp. NPDC053493]|uniref:hypothetical protein n=1 Tax=Streptomyces sp. NPDC053493 TaxID=3365705 RepID=UPI0037D421A1
MVLIAGVVATAAAALAASDQPGRLRPWRRLGDWAADQLRHAVTAPRTSWRTMHAPATDTTVPVPEKADSRSARLRKSSRGGRPPGFDEQRYKKRNTVERARDPV